MPDSERYSVVVVGTCEHQWPGWVVLKGALARDAFGGHFTLDRDDGTCPECGANATCVLFGLECPDLQPGGAPPASALPPESHGCDELTPP